MKILKCKKLEYPMYVVDGDSVQLHTNGELVCAKKITKQEKISHWALVEIASGLGYFIGDEGLPAELKKLAAL